MEVGGWGGLAVTWQPCGPIWSAAVGKGGAGLRSSPSGLRWAGVLQYVRLCGLASAGAPRLLGQVRFPKWSHIAFPGASMPFLVCMPLTLCTTYNEEEASKRFLVIFNPMSDKFETNKLSRVVAQHCGAMRRAISQFPNKRHPQH